jgi:hypothetical protein
MVKQLRMRKATTPNRKGRKLVMMIMLMCSPDSHSGEGIDMKELLHNIECNNLLENRKRCLDNLDTMKKVSK